MKKVEWLTEMEQVTEKRRMKKPKDEWLTEVERLTETNRIKKLLNHKHNRKQ